MDLNGHGLAGSDSALAGHGLGASIASDVVAGDAGDGVVAQGKTGAGATVNLVLVSTVCRHVGVIRGRGRLSCRLRRPRAAGT